MNQTTRPATIHRRLLCRLFVLVAVATFLISPSKGQRQRQSAEAQALSCVEPDEKPECSMYMTGFVDTVRFIMTSAESSKVVCPDTDPAELVPEFQSFAQKNPNVDANTLLFKMLKEEHMCAAKDVKGYTITPAGKLLDLCHTSDEGFRLCEHYQRGFLDAIFHMSEETKISVFCGNLSIVDASIQIMNSEVEADFHLRQKAAASVMFGALQSRLPCPKEAK